MSSAEIHPLPRRPGTVPRARDHPCHMHGSTYDYANLPHIEPPRARWQGHYDNHVIITFLEPRGSATFIRIEFRNRTRALMDDLEQWCWKELEKLGCDVLFYYRYVDDTILYVQEHFISSVVNVFNSYHPSLKFTFEQENRGHINFLDMTLINRNGRVCTNWYRKSSNTTRLLSFKSKHSTQQKINVVYNLTDRAILLSDKSFHASNLNIVSSLLQLNDYPRRFIDKYIHIRLQEIRSKSLSRERGVLPTRTFASELKTERSGCFGHSREVLGQQWCFAPYILQGINLILRVMYHRGSTTTAARRSKKVVLFVQCGSAT
ncbi:unnamed protein product [Trichogramma brassicae]|uniref:Helix-turn-helix domain-containing protein n=1 Tax=Trichogramma brassicae TaxID=86971 RepID=A0A6H5II50_9HYME|nr:unnamed protein product [Trichogramma brassicae]